MQKATANMLACNQPGHHTGLVLECCRSEGSPFVCVSIWAPVSSIGEFHRPIHASWYWSLCQRVQHGLLPLLSYVLAKLWVSPHNLRCQIWISIHFQFAAICLNHGLHWVDVHGKHLQTNNQIQFIRKYCPYRRSGLDSICDCQIVSSVGVTKCENEVIFFLLQVPLFLHHCSYIMVSVKSIQQISTTIGFSIQTTVFNEWCSSTAALCACMYTVSIQLPSFDSFVRDGLLLLFFLFFLSHTCTP